MELEISRKFENMCRTCMTVANEEDSLLSIYDYVEQDGQIPKMYVFELLEDVIHQLPRTDRTDELPKTICSNCFTKLSANYQFQQMSLCSDNHFRQSIAVNCNDIFSSDSQAILLDPLQENYNKELSLTGVEGLIKQETLEAEFLDENDPELDKPAAEKSPSPNCAQSSEAMSKAMETTKVKASKDKKVGSSVTCNYCKKQFPIRKYLREHEKRMHYEEYKVDIQSRNNSKNDQAYKCNECGSTFGQERYLQRHKFRHKKMEKDLKKSFKCNSCEMAFLTIYSLKNHILCSHQDPSNSNKLVENMKPHVCEYCNKAFRIYSSLKEHKRVHTKETPFLCSHCGKAFHSNSNLQQHLLRHTDVRKYECRYCPRSFPCISDLSTHTKQVHKKLRPHTCGECGAAFTKLSQLKTHQMYHSGEKRFQCEYCEMRFVGGDAMRRHVRTHTGEKPYKCKYCPRSFSQSNDMIKHLRTHLGENVYQCDLCPSAFRLASEKRKHFALHKNDDEETRERNRIALIQAQENLRIKMELNREVSVGDTDS